MSDPLGDVARRAEIEKNCDDRDRIAMALLLAWVSAPQAEVESLTKPTLLAATMHEMAQSMVNEGARRRAEDLRDAH